MSLWLSGIGVSRGIVIGRVHRLVGDLDIPEYEIEPDQVETEIKRFNAAVADARTELQRIRDQIPANAPADIAAFIDTHLLMTQDSTLTEAAVKIIRERRCNAEWALKQQQDSLTAVFDQMDDAYLATRRNDVEHVTHRIQRVLLDQAQPTPPKRKDADEPLVLVAEDITPADIIILDQQGVGAFITEYGGPLSHTAILARSLGIPTIVGLHEARSLLADDEQIIVDGEKGHALAQPDESALDFYRHRQERDKRYRRMLSMMKDEPSVTEDGIDIGLLANIELPEDSKAAREAGAQGIGLFRTEFLYMNREESPSEEEQLEAYRNVLDSTAGPVTVRTLDLGADKTVNGRASKRRPNNPALGMRAIRLCLKETSLFRVQLRALLRASATGELKIMLPMITNLQELRQARHLIEECKEELRKDGLDFDPEVPVGAMIEVPAAALAAPLLARHADFFSLGTNDLIQYTLAIDRIDDEINYLYDPLHPAVLRLIRITIESGEAAGIPVALCGEMASDTKFTRLLLGLGLTEFSMHPANILEVKRVVTQSDAGQLREHARRILDAGDAAELNELLDQLNERGELAA